MSWARKILRINLSNGTVKSEPLNMDWAQKYLGQRGLATRYLVEEIDPKTDAMGPGNEIIYATGPLTGTAASTGGRYSVVTKGPLTNAIACSNSGGYFGAEMKFAGWDMVILEGKSPKPVYILIQDDKCEIRDATPIWGTSVWHTDEWIKKEHQDPMMHIACIGIAGEKGCLYSAIVNDLHRAAGRSGVGAVMGSKNVKAIVIDGAGGPGVTIADRDALKAASGALTKGILAHPAMAALEALGSAFLVNVTQSMGCLCTRNFSAGQFEGAQAISGEHLAELLAERPNATAKHSCMAGCIVNCSQVFTDAEGNEVTSGVEFETIGLLGANCAVSDLDQIARIDRLCDDLGLDTMDVGAAAGVAMEAGLLEWGDGAAVHALLSRLTDGDPNAALLADGCVATGKALGVTRVPAVKGQGMAAYDPRVLKGTGTTYATAPQGADHTCGNALPSPANPTYDPAAPEQQAGISEFLQAYFAAIDSLGMCLFATLPALDMPELQPEFVAAAAAITGKDLPEDYLITMGREVVLMERDFNRRAGFTAADDRIPAFMLEEPVAPSGNVYDVSEADLDAMFTS